MKGTVARSPIGSSRYGMPAVCRPVAVRDRMRQDCAPLGNHLQRLLEDPSRWTSDTGLFTVAGSMHNAGRSCDDFVAAITGCPHGHALARAAEHPTGADARLRQVWHWVESKRAEGGHVDAEANRQALLRALGEWLARPWSGAGGANEALVLAALHAVAYRLTYSVFVVAASTSMLADLAAIRDTGTVWRALGRLDKSGRVQRDERGEFMQATRWRLHRATDVNSDRSALGRGALESIGHDVFTVAGLNTGCWLTWLHLSQVPVTVASLCAVTGWQAKTVRLRLKELARVGLSSGTRRQWVRGSATLDEAAVSLGVVGEAERIRADLRELRDIFRAPRAPAVQVAAH